MSRFNTLGWLMAGVVAAAVTPISIVALYSNFTAARAGARLLEQELNGSLDRVESSAKSRWEHRNGELLLFADNAEIGPALARGPDASRDDSVMHYLRSLHEATRRYIPAVVFRDMQGQVRFRLREEPGVVRTPLRRQALELPETPTYPVRIPIYDGSTQVGVLEAAVRTSGFLVADTAAKKQNGARLTVLTAQQQELYSDGPASQEPALTVRREIREPAVVVSITAPLGPYTEPFERASRVGLIALVIGIVSSALISLHLANRFSNRLENLADAATEVASGNLQRTVDVAGPFELQRVAGAFNTMTGSLSASLDALARQRSLAAVGEFAASLAHEVRNGLMAIRVDVQRAQTKATGQSAQILERALDHVVQMDRVVTGALQVARSGRESRQEDVLLTDVVERAAEAAHAFLGDVTVQVSVRPERVRGDTAALTQCVLNLLLNAIDASCPGGRVIAQSRREESSLCIDVEDTGSGFSADALAHAFEPLFTTKASGTGLGLSIARQIALAHGGDIHISNIDQGARVSLILPKPS